MHYLRKKFIQLHKYKIKLSLRKEKDPFNNDKYRRANRVLAFSRGTKGTGRSNPEIAPHRRIGLNLSVVGPDREVKDRTIPR